MSTNENFKDEFHNNITFKLPSRKKEILDYVIKVASYTLDLIKTDNDPLLKSLDCFIYGNLGINVYLSQRKFQVLDDIQTLFEERSEEITEYNLDKLEIKMYRLDRNIEKNIEIIEDFIFENYNIKNTYYNHIGPYRDTHEIINEIMSLLKK